MRQRVALILGRVKGIGKFGRQHTAPLAGGYHRRTPRWVCGLRRELHRDVAGADFRGTPSPYCPRVNCLYSVVYGLYCAAKYS